jgi:multidrug efflux pump subunit AcrA (membrane-fusion protein)
VLFRSAREKVNSLNKKLSQLGWAREYINAERELSAARESLNRAARAYFDMLLAARPDLQFDEGAALAATLSAVSLGGEPGSALMYGAGEAYTAVIASPIGGNVLEISASRGAAVSTNAPVMTISDMSAGLSLTVKVSEDDAAEMAVGDMADIVTDSERYQSRVESISASSESGMYDVEFLLPASAGVSGQRVSMRFRKRTENYDLLIPLSTLRTDNDGDFVYIIERQEGALGARTVVRRVDVYVLESDASRAALQSGVTSRDALVSRSDRDIADGDRVRVEDN